MHTTEYTWITAGRPCEPEFLKPRFLRPSGRPSLLRSISFDAAAETITFLLKERLGEIFYPFRRTRPMEL